MSLSAEAAASGLLFFDKPSGVPTHAVDPGDEGFAEALSRFAGEKLLVVHRLDKGTSGAMALARSREAAASAAAAFAEHRIHKQYLFVTDGRSDRAEFEAESSIRRERAGHVSESPSGAGANARTRFRRLRQEGRFSLWQAFPSTGKSHQIRLHAQASGLPILGDEEHGGSPFPRLLLHAEELAIELPAGRASFRSEPPAVIRDLRWLARPRVAAWLCARERRDRWMDARARAARHSSDPRPAATDAWRTAHDDSGPLRSERLGPVEWLSWYAPAPPDEGEWLDIRAYLEASGRDRWFLQHRLDRGAGGGKDGEWMSDGLPTRWTAQENGLTYEFRRDSGLSSGLFLDQRANRLWALRECEGARVLNLFCYTAGFSVCAAAGGAAKTVSIDSSKTALEWGRRNLELNGLPTEAGSREGPPRHEFRAMDSREYLAWAGRKGLKFDVVICDPPSFSRSAAKSKASATFRIERDLPSLAEGVRAVLAPGGRALICSNFEGWDQDAFEAALGGDVMPAHASEWDFEGPIRAGKQARRENRASRQLKAAFVDQKVR